VTRTENIRHRMLVHRPARCAGVKSAAGTSCSRSAASSM
jgi:hypothetical protein